MKIMNKKIDGLTVDDQTGKIERFGQTVKIRTDNQSKYPFIQFKINGKRIKRSAHKVVVQTITDYKCDDLTIHHINHERNDFRPTNLYVCDRNEHNKIERDNIQVKSNLDQF